jgi:Domain of unknown function (DUF4136)
VWNFLQSKLRFLKTFLVGAGLVAAFCCLGAAQKVRTDHDKSANFERYHTHYWAIVQASNPLWEKRIQDAVDKDLQSKGWQSSDKNGEIAVTAVGSARDQQEYQTFYNGLGGWRWGAGTKQRPLSKTIASVRL